MPATSYLDLIGLLAGSVLNGISASLDAQRIRTLRESLRTFEDKLIHGSLEEAQTAYRAASQLLDKTASKGVIHKNTAARKKSRLNSRLKARALAKR